MFGAGEFVLERLQEKQVKRGEKHCLQSEIKI